MRHICDRGIDRREIRVLVVVGHPALRTGLQALLDGESGIRCTGVGSADGLLKRVLGDRPDVIVLDYAPGEADGLTLCFRLKQLPAAPGVVVYSAYADDAFAVPAAMAQADALVATSAPAGELLATIRRVARNELARPRLDTELVAAASVRVAGDDLQVAGMLLGAVPVETIAQILDLPVGEVRGRALRIIGRLRAGSRMDAAAATAGDDVVRTAARGIHTLHDAP